MKTENRSMRYLMGFMACVGLLAAAAPTPPSSGNRGGKGGAGYTYIYI